MQDKRGLKEAREAARVFLGKREGERGDDTERDTRRVKRRASR